MTTKRFHKTLQIQDGQMEGNTLTGDAAGIGNLDCYDDVIFPGFFSGVLDGFLANGFIADNHDWTKQLAMPLTAEERGRSLYTEAEFHSTQDAQDARTKAQERMAKGKSVGLSIGFSMLGDGYKTFPNGPALLAYARKNGYDMSLFDVEGITAHAGTCQALLKCHELYEYSLAIVPANRAATATGMKTGQPFTSETLQAYADSLHAAGLLNAAALEDIKSQASKAENHTPGNHTPAAESDAFALVTLSEGGVRLKGEYLGEDIEAELAMSALSRLTDRLFYRLFYQNIVGSYEYDADLDEYVKNPPALDDALVSIAGGLDEFKAIVLRVVEAILRGAEGAETAEDAATTIKALWGDPETKTFGSDASRAGESFQMQLTAVLATVQGCATRAKSIQDLRAKDGRVLSQATRDKLTAHRDALADCLTTLNDLLTETESKAARDARAQAALHLRAKQLARKHHSRALPAEINADTTSVGENE